MSTKIQWTDETLPKRGGIRTAAARIGISVADYLSRVAEGQKYCWRCRGWRDGSQFARDSSRWDGRASACFSCRRKPKQLRLIRPTPAESARLHYATDAAFRRRRNQRTAARRRGVEVVPLEGCEALLEKFNNACAYCGGPAETWDHIVPVSQGGRTVPGNIVPACKSCNSKKKDRSVYDFIDAVGIVVTAALEAELALGYEWGCLQ